MESRTGWTFIGGCLMLAIGVGTAGPDASAAPPECGAPGAGSCFLQHGVGCDDAPCCNVVCAIDPFCCNVSWDGICVNEAGAACPIQPVTEGVINPRTGHRHRLLSPKPWFPSQAFAQAQGEHLVTIDDAFENTWLRDNLARNLDDVQRTPWIGLSDQSVEGAFVWASDQPVSFLHWYPGEPNDQGGEDFVAMDTDSGRWFDLDADEAAWGLTERERPSCGPGAGSCFAAHGPGCAIESCCHVVCEANPFCCSNAWDSQCVALANAWCAPGVVVGPIYNPGTFHKYYLLETTSWSEGEKKALELFGHLASIEFAGENEWLRLNLQGFGGVDRSPFIGLHDQAFEGAFRWTSHAPTTYLNWAPGEPSNTFNEDHAVLTAAGTWSVARNTANGHHAIVEVPCTGDLDASGIVDGEDLGALLGAWAATVSEADLNLDGVVDGSDLGILLGSWGSCGSSSCCVAWGGLGCDQPGCTACVCTLDPFCCATAWDQFCADESSNECYAACQCLVIE